MRCPRKNRRDVSDSFCEASNAVGNRQAYDNHVDEQTLEQVMKFVRTSGMERGEGQNDEVHEVFDGGAEEQATDEGMLGHEGQAAAGGVVDGRR